MFGCERMQPAEMAPVLSHGLFGAGISIKKRELFFGRQQRLMIMWSVQIDQLVPYFLENCQSGWTTVDELTVYTCARECPLNDEIIFRRVDTGLFHLRFEFAQIGSAEH